MEIIKKVEPVYVYERVKTGETEKIIYKVGEEEFSNLHEAEEYEKSLKDKELAEKFRESIIKFDYPGDGTIYLIDSFEKLSFLFNEYRSCDFRVYVIRGEERFLTSCKPSPDEIRLLWDKTGTSFWLCEYSSSCDLPDEFIMHCISKYPNKIIELYNNLKNNGFKFE